jgi:hypothetical protein
VVSVVVEPDDNEYLSDGKLSPEFSGEGTGPRMRVVVDMSSERYLNF